MKKLLLLLFVIFSISTSYAQIATTVTNNGYCRNEATGERLKVKKGTQLLIVSDCVNGVYKAIYKDEPIFISSNLILINKELKKLQNWKL